MFTITDPASWENTVEAISTTDPLLGGEQGHLNIGLIQIAKRTQYLKKQLEEGLIAGVKTDEIVDNLLSTEVKKALSANQGKVLKGLIDNINTLLLSDDVTLDTMQELVSYIKQNKGALSSLNIDSIFGLKEALDKKIETTDITAGTQAEATTAMN